MAKVITQRTLRNDSGEIMRGLDSGESYTVTRTGVPVGELVPDRRRARGMVDTSVLIDPPPESALPQEASVAVITLAELVAGVHATRDPNERAARHDRLQRVQAALE